MRAAFCVAVAAFAIALTATFATVAAVTVAGTAFATLAWVVCFCFAVASRCFGGSHAGWSIYWRCVIMAWTFIATVFAARCAFTLRCIAALGAFSVVAVFFARYPFVACFSPHFSLGLQRVFRTTHLAACFNGVVVFVV